MGPLSKVKSVFKSPALLAAYLRWVLSKLIFHKAVSRVLSTGARLHYWHSFSEYWSFRKPITDVEEKFMRGQIDGNTSGMVAIDVGANVGAFTLFMASFAKVFVHAFEPIPSTFCRLTDNVSKNGFLDRCRLNCFGVGERSGLVIFGVSVDSPATNRLADCGGLLREYENGRQTIPVVSLDEYCEYSGLEYVDLVKVDVEGMEPQVIKGAKRLLSEQRVGSILIEVCPSNLRSVGSSASELYECIAEHGWVPYRLIALSGDLAEVSPIEFERIRLENVVLLPRERACRPRIGVQRT